MPDKKIESVYDLITERIGVKVAQRIDPESTTVTTTDAIIARRDPKRLALTIINLSVNTIYVRPNFAASSMSGMVLSPGGGFVNVSYPDDFALAAEEWHAIASGIGSAVLTICNEIRS
jgi:hypothetical protein